MLEYLEMKMSESFILTGAGLAMGIDNSGDSFYVLHLSGYRGADDDISEINVVIPPIATEDFLRVVKAMETKRE